MSGGDLHQIFAALGDAEVRYLVVGGVAVVLHGHPRFTADLDMIVALDRDNALAAVGALSSLGYQPRAPVALEQFADPDIRRAWIEDKGMTVFSLSSPALPATEVDLFVEEPLPFEEAWSHRVTADLGSTRVTVASIADLIALKRAVGRPRDLEDVAALEAIAKEDRGG